MWFGSTAQNKVTFFIMSNWMHMALVTAIDVVKDLNCVILIKSQLEACQLLQLVHWYQLVAKRGQITSAFIKKKNTKQTKAIIWQVRALCVINMAQPVQTKNSGHKLEYGQADAYL